VNKCASLAECAPYLSGHAAIPHVIIDRFLPLLTANEWKILTYVARRASFKPGRDFGRIFLTYKQITEATGVKQPGRCLKRLEALHLIDLRQAVVRQHGKFATLNTVTVRWFNALLEIKAAVIRQRDDAQTSTKIAVSFDEYRKAVNVDAETAECIERFLEAHEYYRKEKHPLLRPDQWRRIVETFRIVEVDGDVIEVDADTIQNMIDRYFDYPSKGAKDFRIFHFNEPGIKEVLWINVCDNYQEVG
jgi:hypothetical protein